jgi:hypothetical protein
VTSIEPLSSLHPHSALYATGRPAGHAARTNATVTLAPRDMDE